MIGPCDHDLGGGLVIMISGGELVIMISGGPCDHDLGGPKEYLNNGAL